MQGLGALVPLSHSRQGAVPRVPLPTPAAAGCLHFQGLSRSRSQVLPHRGVSAPCAQERVPSVGTNQQHVPAVLMQLPRPLLTRNFCDCHTAPSTCTGLALGSYMGWGTGQGSAGTGAAVAEGQQQSWGMRKDWIWPVPGFRVPPALSQYGSGLKPRQGARQGKCPQPPRWFQLLPEPRLHASPGMLRRTGASWLPVPGPGCSRANLPVCCSGW